MRIQANTEFPTLAEHFHFANLDEFKEGAWSHSYLVRLGSCGLPIFVNARGEAEAWDYVIDYCDEHLPGLIMDQEQEEELRADYRRDHPHEGDNACDEWWDMGYVDEYLCGGNAGLHLSTHNISIARVDFDLRGRETQ